MGAGRVSATAAAAVVAAAVALAVVAPADPAEPGPVAPAADHPAAPVDAADEAELYTLPVAGAVVRGFEEPTSPWGAGHRGIDLAAGPGAPVLAAGDGVVAFAGVVVDRPVISIDHPDGIRTTYEPVVAEVAAGDAVAAGQRIGTLAGEGHCDPSSCLHWGARTGEVYLDPLSLLRARQVRLYPVTGDGPVRGPPQARGWAWANALRRRSVLTWV